MTGPGGRQIARPALESALRQRILAGHPLLLTGPPGAGKTTALLALAKALTSQGWTTVYLDLMGAVSSPDRFVAAALEALPAEAFGSRLAQATGLRRLAAAGRSGGLAAVQALFELWATLSHTQDGRPVALLLDEATEIRSLAYFQGLRQVDRLLAEALTRRPQGTVLATSFPTLARKLWPDLAVLEAAPLTLDELRAALGKQSPGVDPTALLRASFGWARYARVLIEAVSRGPDLTTAWTQEMSPGGRLESLCRHTHESLLLRSRGYGMSKAVLAAVADEEGLNLTALVERLGRTPGAIRDYLGWLLGVDALTMVGKRYFYVDGMVRVWVCLHGRGTPARPEEIRRLAEERAGEDTTTAARQIDSEPGRQDEVPVPPPRPVRRDSLVEID